MEAFPLYVKNIDSGLRSDCIVWTVNVYYTKSILSTFFIQILNITVRMYMANKKCDQI